MFRQFGVATILVLPLAGCGPAPTAGPLANEASPIIGGTVDDGDPAVVLVYGNDPTAGGFLCTGSVIAPRVVLTAGHCTNGNVPLPCAGAACGVGDPKIYTVLGGTNPGSAPDWSRAVAEVRVHPDIQLNDDGSHDVGVLILAEDAPVTPLPWQSAPGDAAYAVGTPFTAVGYGMDSMDPNTANVGTKRSVALSIRGENPSRFFFGDDTSNIYEGDSGGPAIANGVVIGTHSYGFADSTGQLESADMRTDENADFIAAAIGASEREKAKHDSLGCSVADPAAPAAAAPLALLPLLLAAAFTHRERLFQR
ncbi:MAG TPA: trypsin-like serine protease [bacterium]|nr:trypsin-like serine protease [bacterium]